MWQMTITPGKVGPFKVTHELGFRPWVIIAALNTRGLIRAPDWFDKLIWWNRLQPTDNYLWVICPHKEASAKLTFFASGEMAKSAWETIILPFS